MLSYALAVAVAISSLILFLTAFLMSDIHRKDDFLWSAVGFFYALILWFCARNITGAVLLGQASASILLVSFIWQTLKLRKAVAHPERAIAISNFSVLQAVNGLLKGKKKPQVSTTPPVPESPDVVTESEISIPETSSGETELSVEDSTISQKKIGKTRSFGSMFGKKKEKISDPKPDNRSTDKTLKNAEPEITLPQTSTKSDREIEVPTPDESIVEKPEIEDKPKAIADTPKEAVQEEAAVNSPEIIETEQSLEETKVEAEADNKIVEVETETIDRFAVEVPVEVKPEPQENTLVKETANLSETVVEDDLEQPKVENPEPNPEAELTPTKTEETQAIKPKAKTSSLDSLETVEVAEVLEALPENSSEDRNRDRSTIIEVTTTEIKEVIEIKQIDDDPDLDTKDSKSD